MRAIRKEFQTDPLPETEIRQRGCLLEPGEPDVISDASVVRQTPAPARAASIGLPADRRAGTAGSRARRRPYRKPQPAFARRPRREPLSQGNIATPEIRR